MDEKQREIQRAERAILRLLQESGPQDSAVSFVNRLKDEGLGEAEIRTAFWELMDSERIELTRDRVLRVR